MRGLPSSRAPSIFRERASARAGHGSGRAGRPRDGRCRARQSGTPGGGPRCARYHSARAGRSVYRRIRARRRHQLRGLHSRRCCRTERGSRGPREHRWAAKPGRSGRCAQRRAPAAHLDRLCVRRSRRFALRAVRGSGAAVRLRTEQARWRAGRARYARRACGGAANFVGLCGAGPEFSAHDAAADARARRGACGVRSGWDADGSGIAGGRVAAVRAARAVVRNLSLDRRRSGELVRLRSGDRRGRGCVRLARRRGSRCSRSPPKSIQPQPCGQRTACSTRDRLEARWA